MKDIYIVLNHLAESHRHVLSRWRAHLILRQTADPLYKEDKARRVVKKLEKEQLIKPLEETEGRLYQVTSPYARQEPTPYEIVSEAYFTSIFCYSTAFQLRQLSDQRSREVHLFLPKQKPSGTLQFSSKQELKQAPDNLLIPLGSSISDWRTTSLPQYIHLSQIQNHPLSIHQTKSDWLFGYETIDHEEVTVRCTDLERTLIDGLRYPRRCGGLNEVFRGWVRALEEISRDRLVAYAEQFDQLILYQRLGFVMETLELDHPKLQQWKEEKTRRGGSRVLNPSKEYSSTYSEEWDLSLNHPTSILDTKDVSYS